MFVVILLLTFTMCIHSTYNIYTYHIVHTHLCNIYAHKYTYVYTYEYTYIHIYIIHTY